MMELPTPIYCATYFFAGAALVAVLTGNEIAAKVLAIPNILCSGLIFGWLARERAERKKGINKVTASRSSGENQKPVA